jgi:lipopolysaccharide export system permease protein
VIGGILQRMILWELLKVFTISLVGITGILLLAGIVAEASQQGLGPGQILAAIPLLIPSTLPYTIPATTLFAACVVYGRMAADNEILAIRSAGVNIGAVALPGLALGVAVSGVAMLLYLDVIPLSHRMLRDMIVNDAEELIYSVLRRTHMLTHPSMPYSVYVRNIQGRKLIKPIFKHQDKTKQNEVCQAREAELRVDKDNKRLLIHMRDGAATFEDGSLGYFQDKIWDMDLPENYRDEQRRARDLTWRELYEKRARDLADAETCKQEITLVAGKLLLQGAPSDLPLHLKQLRAKEYYLQQQVLLLDVELLMRPALAAGCFFFIVIGCPVGIWFGRSDYLSSFITCFMPIVFLYYPLMLCGTGIAKEGRVHPMLMVWAADVLIALVGVGLLYRLVRK